MDTNKILMFINTTAVLVGRGDHVK